MMVKVSGFCPMGCGQTLFVINARDTNHRIECCDQGCARPTAVDELLADPETEHIVEFDRSGFAVQHPLRERLDSDLFTCSLHEQLGALSGPPVAPGRYRAITRLEAPGVQWAPVVPPRVATGDSAEGGE